MIPGCPVTLLCPWVMEVDSQTKIHTRPFAAIYVYKCSSIRTSTCVYGVAPDPRSTPIDWAYTLVNAFGGSPGSISIPARCLSTGVASKFPADMLSKSAVNSEETRTPVAKQCKSCMRAGKRAWICRAITRRYARQHTIARYARPAASLLCHRERHGEQMPTSAQKQKETCVLRT